MERFRGVHDLPIMVESLLRFFWRAAGNFRHHRRTSHARGGKQVVKPQTVAVSLAVLMVVAGPRRLSAADSTGPAEIRQIKQEIRRIKTEEERERARQEKLIEQLERKVDQLQSQNQQLLKSNDKLQATSQNLQSQT